MELEHNSSRFDIKKTVDKLSSKSIQKTLGRILFISHYSNYHGANRSLVALIKGLKEWGYDSFVVCPQEGPFTEELNKLGISYECIPICYWMARSKEGRWTRLFQNLKSLPKLCRLALHWNIDLIYSNSTSSPAGAFLSLCLRKPHIWHVREFGVLDFGLDHDWGKTIFLNFLKLSKAVIVISEAVRKKTVATLSNTRLIYNGILTKEEFEQLKISEKKVKAQKAFTFALVGQINSNKNQLQALEAMSLLIEEFPDLHLLVAGKLSGSYGKKLIDFCELKNLKNNVAFLGYVDDPFKVYMNADVALMCSQHEAFGRVTAEAMFAGKAVIGLANEGTLEIIQQNQNGLLYDGTTISLVEAMRELIMNPEKARALGRQARADAEKRYFIEDYSYEISQVIGHSLNG